MLFWNSLAFSMIQWMLTIWSLIPLPFLNPIWTSGSSWFTYCWSLAWSSFSTELKWKSLSHAWLFGTPQGVAHEAPLSMEFSRQEYWSGLPFPSPRGYQVGSPSGIPLPSPSGLPFPSHSTQGSNPVLPHCGRILYHLSHQGSLPINKN